ncbi:WAP domain containing protein, SLPI-like [Trichuris trichiura]|uniref:WAP domain containing protein, SLPI-like n=1 Tax=Trichuris trichiura TaxID=36087 RepID=A0A077ZD43_TRITR|nr:WAP domain containing protein, SLPI-like [Trichuris trichiura]
MLTAEERKIPVNCKADQDCPAKGLCCEQRCIAKGVAAPKAKEGFCPSTTRLNVTVRECENDKNCPAKEKCCHFRSLITCVIPKARMADDRGDADALPAGLLKDTERVEESSLLIVQELKKVQPLFGGFTVGSGNSFTKKHDDSGKKVSRNCAPVAAIGHIFSVTHSGGAERLAKSQANEKANMKEDSSGKKCDQTAQMTAKRKSSTIGEEPSKTLAQIATKKGIPIESLHKVELVDVDLPPGCEEVTIPKYFTGDLNPGMSKEQITQQHKELVKNFEKLLKEAEPPKPKAEKKSKSDSSIVSTGSEASLPSADKIAKQLERKEPPKKPPTVKKGRLSFFN